MEASALNLAHERQRRAEALLREGRFEEAADCHEAVVQLLSEAFTQLQSNFTEPSITESHPSILIGQSSIPFVRSIHTAITLESLALQRDYHKRQAAVVRMKQAQYEEYKANLETQKRDLISKQIFKQNEKGNSTESASDRNNSSLRQALFRTIEEQDSLLSLILLPDTESSAFKHPKDTGTVIEELKTVNCQLRCLVGSLLSQLEAKEEEVKQLTERLHAISVNPNDEIRPDDTHSLCLAPLPPLTPLEMPLFDFTSS
ncbi:nuclear receptor-binding factor 2-like [Vespa mandarinia]|uniref:nuclear receptor-binding factor 2-like n=1 Tax=Vespa mandarinia TaxID=7446 RepID=UPI00161AC3B4|nr:nuclear receptor-binding factor 2-like [Vespa mandarinia]XP_046816363.1 nuclear receptor-binding factor 2-like [Vespa crabro]XP_047347154.1 nuclear receptor-binding factor 2-like [Vespa velutina]